MKDWRGDCLPKMWWRWMRAGFIATVVVAASARHAQAAGGNTAKLRIAQDNATVSIFSGDRLVLRYRYAGAAKKSYVDQLASPGGVQILRDWPPDHHRQHHGLMFCVSVDNLDFWSEEKKECGRQEHRCLREVTTTAGDGVQRAGLTEELDWVDPTLGKPLLRERRAIAVLKADDFGATLVSWRCRLQAPPGKSSALLGGRHYVGLGMRFAPLMDQTGQFFNADDKPGTVVRGDERLTPVKWCAYTARVDGKSVTVAVFDHPANARYPAQMFTMSKPFAFLSVTLNLWKEPFTVSAGQPLDLCYGVALWDGAAEKSAIEELYQRWAEMSGR